MAKPKNGKGKFTHGFVLDDETLKRVEKLSKELCISKSGVVRLAIRELYIQKLVRK